MSLEHALRALVTDGITAGRWGPGVKLPTERELVDQMDAPRSAVRQALAALERDGLIVRMVGRGTYLTDTWAKTVSAAPADCSPAEIMQVRLLLEPQIAPLAAREANQADLERIRHALRRGGAAAGFDDFEAWDAALHRAIAQAAHNVLLLTLFDAMNAARQLPVWGGLKRRTSTPQRQQCYHAEHTAIVEALGDRDPDQAGLAMRTHLDSVTTDLLGRS